VDNHARRRAGASPKLLMKRSVWQRIVWLLAAMLALGGGPALRAGQASVGHTYEGVATCAGSTCHGRGEGNGVTVRQDELATWQNPSTQGGAHSRAYAVLASARGARIAAALGLEDAAAVVTEPFSQWVIEDRFAGPRPRWEAVGAELVGDVAPYESAKLRMLNGAHSALAYLGLLRGHSFVHQAVADPAIRPLVEQVMRAEAAPTVAAAPGHDLMAYADALLARFANPALNHRLIQIAMDGSQKVPQRWLETLAEQHQRGHDCPALLTAVAAWLRHLRGDNVASWGPVDDPRAAELAQAWHDHGSAGIVPALFGPGGRVSTHWHPTAADRSHIEALLAPPDG